MNLRLAKRISESSFYSRREAERLILSGQVTVDGEIVTTPVFFVNNDSVILVKGEKIQKKPSEIKIWKLYKPKVVITTKHDSKNRPTVFDFFCDTDINQKIIYIGRLDYNSEGLLLFTNNGDLARKMELPKSKLERTYKVRIFGKLPEAAICKLRDGITIDGINYGSVDIKTNSDEKLHSKLNMWITVTLFEGKNREIRKIMDHFGCSVNRLIRVGYGPFKLGNLKPGEIEIVDQRFIKNFIESW
jgi:23S rRNA pseudouridine2605 synthase